MQFPIVELYKKIKWVSDNPEDHAKWVHFKFYINQMKESGYSFKYVGISLSLENKNVFEFENILIYNASEAIDLRNKAIMDSEYGMADFFNEMKHTAKEKHFALYKINCKCVFEEKQDKLLHYYITGNHNFTYKIQEILKQ